MGNSPSRVENRGTGFRYINKSLKGFSGGAHIFTRAPQLPAAGMYIGSLPTTMKATDTNTGTAFSGTTGTSAILGGALVAVSHAGDGSSELGLLGNVFKPSMAVDKRISMEVRAKFVNSVSGTRGEFVVGFADNATFSGGLPYVFATNGTLSTKVPTNAAVIMSSDVPTGTVTGSASYPQQLNTITSLAATGTVTAGAFTALPDAAFHFYRVEIDASGTCWFYYDDRFLGQSASGAVSVSGSLTPYVQAGSVTGTMTTTITHFWAGGQLV